MSLRQDIGELIEMYSAGGMIVLTAGDGTTRSATAPTLDETYDGKVSDQPGIRTTIQLDMNVITLVSADLANRADVWQRHATAVDARLALIERVQQWARQSWLLFLALPLFWLGSDLMDRQLDTRSLLASAALSGLLYLGRNLIRKVLARIVWPSLIKLLARLLKKRFDAFISEEA